jgi:hypothetical protein
MKQLLLFWVLWGGLTLSAQNVSVPDVIFKNKLITTSCADFNNDGIYDGDVDTNDDGEIQVSEAQAVQRLKINNSSFPNASSITDLTGLGSFSNVKEIQLGYNALTNFAVALPNLEVLKINNNLISNLNLSGLPLLKDLDCSYNQLTTMDLQSVGLLESLKADNNALQSLNLEFVSNLSTLSVQACQLTGLDLNLVPNLIYLKLSDNAFVPNLNPLVNLKTLFARGMGLTSINLTTNINLLLLDLSENEFQNLTLPHLPQLNTLTLSNCNVLQSVNFNALPALTFLEISNAPQLQFINAKNGRTTYQMVSLQSLASLQYICTDQATIDEFQLALNLGGSSAQVNDYCTLQPGGNYNTVAGLFRFDANQNGCELTDNVASFVKLNIQSAGEYGTTFSGEGNGFLAYSTYTNTPYQIVPQLENPNYFTVNPSAVTVNFSQPANQISNNDFCVSANGIYPDGEITIAPEVRLRPGYTSKMRLLIRNKGNQVLNGNYFLNFESGKVTVVSASVAPTNQTQGQLVWVYNNLQPFETRLIELEVYVNSPNQSPAVNVGDALQFEVGMTPNTDAQPQDNHLVYISTTVATYEPNNIICLEGNQLPVSAAGSFLHYMVNFENMGIQTAQQVVVRLNINPAQYIVDSVQLLDTSASSYTRQKDNIVEIFFPNLQVDTGGHGNVLMKVRSKDNLNNGDFVNGRADIFFDYSNPLDTGITQTIYQDLNTVIPTSGFNCVIGPNPITKTVEVSANSIIEKVEVFDVQGRLLQIHLDNESSTTLDFSSREAGIYFLRIYSAKGVVTKKVLKE